MSRVIIAELGFYGIPFGTDVLTGHVDQDGRVGKGFPQSICGLHDLRVPIFGNRELELRAVAAAFGFEQIPIPTFVATRSANSTKSAEFTGHECASELLEPLPVARSQALES